MSFVIVMPTSCTHPAPLGKPSIPHPVCPQFSFSLQHSPHPTPPAPQHIPT
jgi:hypothetical protein